ncbi:selenide, water dikinase SelD, partial [Maricaulis sp.]|uniref:selenide, water dikinase SelD n=1 Tax=Maricaulis sp. TaxID=1486257 RepID=UPI003A8FC99A
AMPAELVVDASTRDDAAVYRLGDDLAIVATTDFFTPIVDDPFDFGRIAATNALSDLYAMGARPIFCLAIVGMPLGKLPLDTIREILNGGRTVAEAAGAPIAGGHSIDAAEPFYGLVALGIVHPDRMLTNAGAKPGDVLILGKPLGIGIYSAAMKRGIITPEDQAEMIASTTLLNRPGTDLAALDGVHAVTDVTGFGLLGHLREVCEGSGVAATLKRDAIPVFPGARRLAETGVRTGASVRVWASVGDFVTAPDDWPDHERDLLCDPQTSGGLLVSCAPDCVADVLAVFARHGHEAATVIGKIEAGKPGINLV